ncbi:hypothetical protein ABE237_00715 [Brevibacillus formosus]|uniref:hypothetical protein n=1 Tax=Brevibacillus formosus TaxID=54913 RepID=UPI0018CFC5B3|nr:hypothetical protein [Brevibacillus formosus]MBG9944671.1 hypothetical protein [Brevibacillus formosus]
MQAGRELDKQIAEALGWEPYLDEDFTDWATNGHGWVPKFSTTGDGMLRLIEEARKQGILFDLDTMEDKYKVKAYRWNEFNLEYDEIANVEGESAPRIVCSAFLWGKGSER